MSPYFYCFLAMPPVHYNASTHAQHAVFHCVSEALRTGGERLHNSKGLSVHLPGSLHNTPTASTNSTSPRHLYHTAQLQARDQQFNLYNWSFHVEVKTVFLNLKGLIVASPTRGEQMPRCQSATLRGLRLNEVHFPLRTSCVIYYARCKCSDSRILFTVLLASAGDIASWYQAFREK